MDPDPMDPDPMDPDPMDPDPAASAAGTATPHPTRHPVRRSRPRIRLQQVVHTVALEMAGHAPTEVARVLAFRLRRMGVDPNDREVSQHAERIAALSTQDSWRAAS